MPIRLPSFWIKVVLAALVIAAGDLLLFASSGIGLNIGLLAMAVVAALGLANPAIRRSRLGLLALLAALALAALQFERPTAIGLLIFVFAVAVAALAPRAHVGDDGWRWGQRLLIGGLKALVGPIFDLRRLLKARSRSRPVKLATYLIAAVLPVGGGLLFLGLFSLANPVISEALGSLNLAEPDVGRIIFWGVLGLPTWALLRPRGLRRPMALPGMSGDVDLPGVTMTSIAASLLVFNVIFSVQNGLDIAYLWSGAGLPRGVSFADYAHKGAYPLIATAILAGLFVLAFLRPGSPTAQSRPIRILVVAWVAQNVFLVASTALRTVDYIEVYSLTRLRIAALLWMALVATGLVLIVWRLLRGRSAGWLVNANLVAVAAILALCSVVDLGSIAAAWNVRHARDLGGKGVDLDLCYMRKLQGAAVVPLATLETRALPPELRDRVQYIRGFLQAGMADRQDRWRGWRWRDERRLAEVKRLTHEDPRPPVSTGRQCDGAFFPPPPPPKPTAPLTPSPNPRT